MSETLSFERERRIIDAAIRSDFYSFLQSAFPIVSPGTNLLLNWHLEAMTAALSKVMRGETRRLIITVPPRSLKSICASVALPAFILGHNPTKRIVCVSYSDVLARKHANDTRALLRSRLYQRLFPETRVSSSKDTESEVMTTARGFRLSTSVGGTLTGRGGDLIVIDDPMKPQDAQSETARRNVLEWYSNTLLSRLDSKTSGGIVVVMQRLHLEDLVGHLLKEEGWTHLNLPAIAEFDEIIPLDGNRLYRRVRDNVLHPERENLAALNELKSAMGSMEFSAQYQQAPVPIGGNIVKWSWFQFYQEPPPLKSSDRVIVSWDTALTSNELSSYSACVILQVRKETVYILDVFRARLEFPALRRKVIEIHERWRHSPNYCLLIENKGSGTSLIQELRLHDIYPIREKPEGDKIMRMYAQTSRIEAGSVFLPKSAPWLDEFRHELLAFPHAPHDDQVDAFSQALKRACRPPQEQASWGTYGN